MILFRQLAAAALLVTSTLCVQCAGVAIIVHWLRTVALRDIRKFTIPRSATLVMETMIGVILLHGSVILLWGACYRWLCLSSWQSAFYFSSSSYSTVGYGDVLIPSQWHLLGPLESMMGVLMCGISVSLLFALITRLVEHETQIQPATASPPNPEGCTSAEQPSFGAA